MRIAGIDIGGTSIKVGVFDGDMLVHKDSRKTPFDSPDAVCDLIADMLLGQNIQLAGVGTAGSVESFSDTVSASNLGWEGVPLRRMLTERLGVPVWVDNDAQAAIMAEWHDGVCRGAECAVYLTLGTGIGGAMIVAGKPYRGKNNLGAEFGHMIIHPDGPRCVCGRRGCLEYYASATALKRMAGGLSCRTIIDRAKAGDKAMLDVFDAFIRELCIGMNTLIMVFDPEYIVLGGGLSGAGEFLAERCQRELERIFADTTDPLYCRVRIARHKNDAGIIGAALLARENLL
ncbi:MAG: ROK family protein [Clostridia bacterium]|nr:ROK family protein [Clostridia bacterium]